MTREEWGHEFMFNNLVASGLNGELAEAVTNLLQLHSMEFHYNSALEQWRVRLQRHYGTFNYMHVTSCATNIRQFLTLWIKACQEVEHYFGHIR